MFKACDKSNLEAVKRLVGDEGAGMEYLSTLAAAWRNSKEIVDYLRSEGANIEAVNQVDTVKFDHESGIYW